MKKLLVLLCLSVALVGCGEKKVTEDMLIGDWQCTLTGQEAKWKNGLFQDYGAPKSETSLVTYLKENDELFIKLPDSDRKIKQNFNNLSKNSYNTVGYRKVVVTNDLKHISDDEFNLITEITITYDITEREKEVENEKIKTSMHCTRIKQP